MKSVLQKLQFMLLFLPIAAMSQWVQLGETINCQYDNTSNLMPTGFGETVAFSEDGTVMAVGAPSGSHAFFMGNAMGHVQVFRLVSGEWIQIGSDIKGPELGMDLIANEPQLQSQYATKTGISLGLSTDGTVLAVGEPNWFEIDGGNLISGGKVRVFRNINDNWVQIGEDIFEENNGFFGNNLSLSFDGNIIAIHSEYASPDDELFLGMVKVFQNVSGSWVQMGSTFQGTEGEYYGFKGMYMSMNADGTKLAISELIGGDFKVGVYEYNNSEWQETSGLLFSSDSAGSPGGPVSLSADGKKIAVGDYYYSTANTNRSGIVRLYGLSADNNWIEEAVFEPQNPVASNHQFGHTVSTSANANAIAIGSGVYGREVNVYQNTDQGWQLVGEFEVEEGESGWMNPQLSANGSVLAIGKYYTNNYYGSVDVYKNCDLAEVPHIIDSSFTEGNTLADLDILTTGGTLTWYADENLNIVLEEDTPLVNDTTYYVTQTDILGCTSKAVAVTVGYLSFTDFVQNNFRYYPNPVSNILNFTIENDRVQVVQLYDLSGKLVFEQKSQNIDAVNLSMLTQGMYVAKVQTESNVHTFKLVKE